MLLKCRFTVCRLGWGPRVCISNQLPDDVSLLVTGPHFQEQSAKAPLKKILSVAKEQISSMLMLARRGSLVQVPPGYGNRVGAICQASDTTEAQMLVAYQTVL